MASGPITPWQIDGETVETVADFILGGSKITADGNWHLVQKVHLVKAMVFPVVMYGCESWTVKKAERWRIDAFELGVGEDSGESLELQEAPTSPF